MIIGIDPSLSNTAVCSGDRTGGCKHAMGTFQSSKNYPGTDVRGRLARFEQLVAQVNDYLETLEPIDAIFIEGYSMGSKWGREQAGEFGGLLRWHLIELSPLIVEVAPTTLKKFVMGKGAGEKDMIAANITSRWGVLLGSNDEYDAYALWRIGRAYLEIDAPANQAQLEVLDKLREAPKAKPRKLKGGERKQKAAELRQLLDDAKKTILTKGQETEPLPF